MWKNPGDYGHLQHHRWGIWTKPKSGGSRRGGGMFVRRKKKSGLPYLKKTPKDTVDGQNLAPPGMVKIL